MALTATGQALLDRLAEVRGRIDKVVGAARSSRFRDGDWRSQLTAA